MLTSALSFRSFRWLRLPIPLGRTIDLSGIRVEIVIFITLHVVVRRSIVILEQHI